MSVLVIGGMLVVSIPSALGARLQVLGYCTAAPVWLSWLAAHSPVHMNTGIGGLALRIGQDSLRSKTCTLYCSNQETPNKDTLVGLYCVHLYTCLTLSSLPPWPKRVSNGAVHHSSRIVVTAEYHSSDVTISQSAHKMFTFFYLTKEQQHNGCWF